MKWLFGGANLFWGLLLLAVAIWALMNPEAAMAPSEPMTSQRYAETIVCCLFLAATMVVSGLFIIGRRD